MDEQTGSDRADAAGGGEAEGEVQAPGFHLFDRGAQVTRWHPPGAAHPALFSGSLASIGPDRPWRGGIPLCVPWFGAGADGKRSPAHGPARTAVWSRLTASEHETRHRLTLDRDATGSVATIELLASTRREGNGLSCALEIRNAGTAPVAVEAALHSYLAVSDVRRIELRGLERASFLDKTTGTREPPGADIPFGAAVDRIYDSADAPIEVRDPAWERVLRVEREGSTRAVVWNPGPGRGPADLAPGEWQRFVCVETAVIGEGSVDLDPGQAHTLRSRLLVN